MNVLLTGPFGKIGYRVVEALLAKGHQVTCFDLDNPANRKMAKDFQGRVTLLWGDITHPDSVANAVAGQEVVIHNAAIIPPGTDRNLSLSEKVNVGGTRNILSAIQQSPLKPLLIFPSSVSIHGNHKPDSPWPLQITSPLHAEDHYAQHKITCEQLIEQSGIRWIILRIGACLEGRNTMPSSDAQDLMKMTFDIHAKVRLEYIHPKDVATAFANAVDTPAAIGKKFFLGGGKSCQTTWRDFNSMYLNAMGGGIFPEEAFGSQAYYTDWMDTEESQRLLQYQHHSLADYQKELRQKFRWIRPFAFLYRSLLRRYLLSHSDHYHKAQSKT